MNLLFIIWSLLGLEPLFFIYLILGVIMSDLFFPYPPAVDYKDYSESLDVSVAYYGLPKQVFFCKSCTYSNQKPNSHQEYKHVKNSKKETVAFNEKGICNACQIAEQKKNIDWQERESELRALCDRYRSRNGSYDCVVPGSGGKDSFFAAHKLKYEYGMHPLTVTWAPHIYTDWGWDNFQSWMHAGFDNYLFTPDGMTHRLLTRLALEQMLHPFQPFIVGQMYYPPKFAAKLGIPLVFYGENPTEYGNKPKRDDARKDLSYFASDDTQDFHLSGLPVETLKSVFNLSDGELSPYLPPSLALLESAKLDVQYLGYYLPWHPQECYYYAVEHGDFRPSPERTAGTYSKYSSIDDKIDDLHYYTTFIKFGMGRATYDSSQEIRNGEIERDEGIALIKRYDGEYSTRFAEENFAYLSLPEQKFPIASKFFEQPIMDQAYFDRLVDRFRSPHLWKYVDNRWQLRHTIFSA